MGGKPIKAFKFGVPKFKFSNSSAISQLLQSIISNCIDTVKPISKHTSNCLKLGFQFPIRTSFTTN